MYIDIYRYSIHHILLLEYLEKVGCHDMPIVSNPIVYSLKVFPNSFFLPLAQGLNVRNQGTEEAELFTIMLNALAKTFFVFCFFFPQMNICSFSLHLSLACELN